VSVKNSPPGPPAGDKGVWRHLNTGLPKGGFGARELSETGVMVASPPRARVAQGSIPWFPTAIGVGVPFSEWVTSGSSHAPALLTWC
jgi:hypothetical protein